jgi:hypothetical protein
LDQPELGALAGQLFTRIKRNREAGDEFTGADAEALMQLLRCLKTVSDPSGILDALALRWAGSLREKRRLGRGLASSSDRLSDWIPSCDDMIGLALARFLSQTPRVRWPETEDALRDHRFDVKHRGGRLAALAVHWHMGLPAPRHLKLPPVDRQFLGSRELLQRIEEAQIYAKYFECEEAGEESARGLRIMLDRKAATGQWFPDRLADDSLNHSALDGTPSIGLALLRHLGCDVPALGILE